VESHNGESAFEKMRAAIKQAVDDYAAAKPELHITAQLTIKGPVEEGKATVFMTNIIAGDISLTPAAPVNIDDYQPEHDGRDPHADLKHKVFKLSSAGHRVDALELAEEIVQRFPKSSSAQETLAFAFAANERKEEAKQALDKAAMLLDDDWVRSRPEYEIERRMMIAQFMNSFGEAETARRQGEKAIETAEAAGLYDRAAQVRSLLDRLTNPPQSRW
jgi:tetratricopeptide (TPR) repeat protein